MKSFINFLPPWVETNIQPAFYDKESGTILQQTARMYAKVNQLVRHFNDLSKETKETVAEYIAKFVELKDFVDTYFENLDVQEEINNKLDDMAEQGQLADIISQYLNSTAIFGYDNVSDMQNADNLVNGSYARTLGYYAKNDGGSALYKIRNITNDDVVDGGSIIAMNDAGNQLIAELIENEVNFKQFGAKGDGTTNDYTAVKNCCDYASANNKVIRNLTGNYYIDGNQIVLTTSVYNSNKVTYTLGNSYEKYNSLFKFEHDSVEDILDIPLSDVFADRDTLQDDYVGKSFLLDTQIKLGQRLDGTDQNETITEPFYNVKKYDRLWCIDYDADLRVNLKSVSNSFEKGYEFVGGKVRQYDNTGFGTSFITVSRNNCTVKGLDIDLESTTFQNCAIYVANGNNCLLEDINTCTLHQTAGGSVYAYDISLNWVSNVVTRNITTGVAPRNWSFGNRCTKNWSMENCTVGVWDIHWNSYGLLNIDNSYIHGGMTIGYGTGIFNMRNSYGRYLATAQNFSPIYNGEINIENSILDDGVHIVRVYTDDPLRDSYFDNMIMPNVTVKNSIRKSSSSKQDLYVNIPAEAAARVSNAGTVIFDNVDLRRIYYTQQASASTPIYNVVLRDCRNVSTNIMNAINALGEPVGEGLSLFSTTGELTPHSGMFTSGTFTGSCIKDGKNVFLKFTGTLATGLANGNTIIDSIETDYISTVNTYGYLYYDTYILPCYVTRFGKVLYKGSTTIPSNTEISVVANYVQ